MLLHLGAVRASPVQTLLVLLLARASGDALSVRLGQVVAWGLLGKVKRLLLAEVRQDVIGEAELSSLSKH